VTILNYAWVDADGLITRGKSEAIEVLPEGAVQLDAPPSMYLGKYATFDGEGAVEAWHDRPSSPVPDLQTGAPFDQTWAVPAGTVVEVYDTAPWEKLDGAAMESGGVVQVHLPDPGTYVLEITAPPPYRAVRIQVVSE